MKISKQEEKLLNYLEKETISTSPWISIDKIALDFEELSDDILFELLDSLEYKGYIDLNHISEALIRVGLIKNIDKKDFTENKDKLDKLEKQIEKAIKGENYELAAELHKKINNLKEE